MSPLIVFLLLHLLKPQGKEKREQRRERRECLIQFDVAVYPHNELVGCKMTHRSQHQKDGHASQRRITKVEACLEETIHPKWKKEKKERSINDPHSQTLNTRRATKNSKWDLLCLLHKVIHRIDVNIHSCRSTSRQTHPVPPVVLCIDNKVRADNSDRGRYQHHDPKDQQSKPIDVIDLVVPKRREQEINLDKDRGEGQDPSKGNHHNRFRIPNLFRNWSWNRMYSAREIGFTSIVLAKKSSYKGQLKKQVYDMGEQIQAVSPIWSLRKDPCLTWSKEPGGS